MFDHIGTLSFIHCNHNLLGNVQISQKMCQSSDIFDKNVCINMNGTKKLYFALDKLLDNLNQLFT